MTTNLNPAFDILRCAYMELVVTPSSAVGGHSGGSERALLLVSAIRWFRNG